MSAQYCPRCDKIFGYEEVCGCSDRQPIKIVGTSEHELGMVDKALEAINETHAQIKTAVAKRNEEEYKRIWNSAIEAAAHQVMINVFHEAQDSEWDLGFNKCKEVAFNKIRELKK